LYGQPCSGPEGRGDAATAWSLPFKQIIDAGDGSCAPLIHVVQFEQRKFVDSLRVTLACSSNVDDRSGHNLGYRIVTIDQLKGFANGFKRGVHGFDRVRLKNGFLQVGCQRHSIFNCDEFVFEVPQERVAPGRAKKAN
jgi:hypothetical protein